MSIIGAVTGAIIVLLRIFKDIPRRVFTWLWAIPFLRFIIPFGISNKLSLIYWLASVTSGIITVKGLDGMNFFVGANAIRAAKSYFPIVYKSEGLELFFIVAYIIWIVVAIVII
ncbi:MAG: peptidase M56 BlaR1, partial [Clostridia bacterium]|nr:peptidase M56 BlaR1 [Clostridia bacterium]